ncbi:MAG: AAA family ATPase [Candidatus Bathyarchaeia archaeon]
MPKVAVHRLPTGSVPIDRLLKGGLPKGGILLVYGEAGAGKTSLAIQCAVTAGRRGWATFFIDADGCLPAERLRQIAAGCLDEVAQLIYIFSPSNFYEQTALLETLDRLTAGRRGLLVVDSISRLYRLEITNLEQAVVLSKELNRQLAYITNTVKSCGIPALLTSHVRKVPADDLLDERVEPVAARALRYWATDIIHLKPSAAPNVKLALLEKYGGKVQLQPPFCYVRLTERGLEGIDS